MIEIKRLSGGYQKAPIIKDVSLSIDRGSFYALIGPNGSGKTTLFKLITGVLPFQEGEITILNRSIHDYTAHERAQTMAVLSQESHVEFDFTVEEIVMLGRYPHQKGFLKHSSKHDHQVVETVMQQTDVLHYRSTPFKWLSGGEKQRVLLAKALAQEPKVLFLDEPTNHLDIKHTVTMLQHLKIHQQSHQLTIVAILHDLNTAALFADKVGLLNNGSLVESGNLSVLQNEVQLEEVYEVAIKHQSHPIIPKPQIVVFPEKTRNERVLDYEFNQTEQLIQITFNNPLRTIANGVIGEGLQWCRNFCNFHVQRDYNCSDPKSDIISWLKEKGISEYDTVGMMTAVNLNDNVIIQEEYEGVNMLSVVTAGVGNAVDITEDCEINDSVQIGTVNIMVFIDAHLTDGALVNAIQSVTEAKTKAFAQLKVTDTATGTIATGTSTDSIVIAATQNGTATPYAGSGTVIGKGMGMMVYKAVTEAVKKYEKRREKYK